MSAMIEVRLAGHFMFEAVKVLPNGAEQRRRLTGWFPNLITNAGLDAMAPVQSDVINAIRVGSGSSAPAVSDTALQTQVASTTTLQSRTGGVNTVGARYGWVRKTFRFATGAAAGNLAEVGVFTAGSGGTCFSRALIVDENGDPTTITILADEQLDVTYELRNYQPTSDGTWEATISSVTYSGVVRMSNSNRGDTGQRTWVPTSDTAFLSGQVWSGLTNQTACFETATLGATTGEPAGTKESVGTITPATYVAGTFQRAYTLQWPLNGGNFASGIGSFLIATTVGEYQFSVSPKIPKTAAHVLNLQIVVSWGRYTP